MEDVLGSAIIRFLRIAIPVFLASMLVGILIWIGSVDMIGQYVLGTLPKDMPGRLRVERFSQDWSGIHLDGVSWGLGGQEPAIEAQRIDLNLSFRALFRRDWQALVSHVRVLKPGVRVVVDANGDLNLSKIWKSMTKASQVDLNRLHAQVDVVDGWILYRDERGTGFLYQLIGWDGAFSLKEGGQLNLDSQAHPAQDKSSTLSVSGTVSLKHPQVNARMKLDHLDLLPFAGYPGFGPGLTLIKGRLGGEALVQGRGETWGELIPTLFPVGKLHLKGGLFATPWLAADLTAMEGDLNFLGREVTTEHFKGSIADIPFMVTGRVGLGPAAKVDARVTLGSFPLQKIRAYVDNFPEIQGFAQADVSLGGGLRDLEISGRAQARDVRFEGETATAISADFLKVKDLLHLSALEALTDKGRITGEGWVFLGKEPRVLLALSSTGVDPSTVAPDLARTADFKVRVLGSVSRPLVYGKGKLQGLGPWAQGANTAEGGFVLTGKTLMLVDGLAFKGESSVRVPVAAVDLDKRQLDGVVTAERFSFADVPGLSQVEGRFSGSALVGADLSGLVPRLSAQGWMAAPSIRGQGWSVEDAVSHFSLEGDQLVVPDAQGKTEGGRVQLSGVVDQQDQALDFVGKGEGVSLARLGASTKRANLWGRVSGSLTGGLGIYAYAETGVDQFALSGFRQSDGRLGGVGWIRSLDAREDENTVLATVVAGGASNRLAIDYGAWAHVPGMGPDHERWQIGGSAVLANRELRIYPTLVTDDQGSQVSEPTHHLTYRGEAYPFFGPLLAGPLTKIVVDDPAPALGQSLLLSGKAGLGRGKLDLKFRLRASELEELADAPLPWLDHQRTLQDILPFQILSGFGTAEGRIGGTWGDPTLQATFSLPWLLFARSYENRWSLGSEGNVALDARGLIQANIFLSENVGNSWRFLGGRQGWGSVSKTPGVAALTGKMLRDGSLDLALSTGGLDSSYLGLLLPQAYYRYLPYGKLASDDLRLWGSISNPSLSGRLRLLRGGVFLAGKPWPIQEAQVSFAGHGGETSFYDLILRSGGLTLTGAGKRSAKGDLSGELRAKDVELETFHVLGGPLAGLYGRVDAVAKLQGRFPYQPKVELAAQGKDLSFDPVVLGGKSGRLSIGELALGHFNLDGTELVDGLKMSVQADGQVWELPKDGLRFQTKPGGLSLQAQGRVRIPGELAELGRLKTFSQWRHYLGSSTGPVFGGGNVPFEVSFKNWTSSEVIAWLGRDPSGYEASGSAHLALYGQWWRDHQVTAQATLPLAALELDTLRFEGKAEHGGSGFELSYPARMTYRREGNAGFLGINQVEAEFFGRSLAQPSQGEDGLNPSTEETRHGVLTVEGKLALTQGPGEPPSSSLHVDATTIPLENLAFLLPSKLGLKGMVEQIDVDLVGLLPSPTLRATALVSKLSLGPLREMTLRGSLEGDQKDEGYQLTLGGPQDSKMTLTLGETDAAVHQLKAEGNATLHWRREQPLYADRLSFFTDHLRVSSDSPVDLAIGIIDKNLRMLADVVPGKDVARGDFSASLSVNGTLGYPQFEGQARLDNGEFLSEHYGEFRDLKVEANVERITKEQAEPSEVLSADDSGLMTRFRLPSFEGTLGKKPFFASGQAEFAGIAPTFLKMFFVGESLPLQMPNLFTGQADIDLELNGKVVHSENGTRLTPLVLGSLSIPEGDFYVPLGASEQKVKGDGLTLPLDYDVTVALGQQFYAHALDSTVRATGDLRLLSERGQPKLYGRLELSRGEVRIPFYDASFHIRQGIAYFEGPMIPRLEAVEAVADMGSYRVVARVEGTYPDRLHVDLFSDPPLPQAELSRMVVLGGLPSQFGGTSEPMNQATNHSALSALSGTGVSFLSGILTNRLTEQIGRFFLLSEVSFDYIPPASYVIKVAKALDPRDSFLLTLTRVIRDNGQDENLYGIEWRFSRNLLTRFAIDQYNQLRFWIQSINRF